MCISYQGNAYLASHMQYPLDASGTLADVHAGMCTLEWMLGFGISVVRRFCYSDNRNVFTTFAFVLLIIFICSELFLHGKFLSNYNFPGLKIWRQPSRKLSFNELSSSTKDYLMTSSKVSVQTGI